MKKQLPTIVLILIFCAGLFLLLYPTVSNYWNEMHQTQVIGRYDEEVAQIGDSRRDDLWNAALEYNAKLAERGNVWVLSDEQREDYYSQLGLAGGIISYIEIPEIDCELPIYHGTDDEVLRVGVGHLEGSSLPTGGENSHCVLFGHRGMPSAQMFTRLDQMEVGDIFILRTLNETLTYEVEQIRIVLPEEMEELVIQKGRDLCTLVTCTPYGVNSHRLLLRGHRIENLEENQIVSVTADARQVDPLLVMPVVAVLLLLVLLIVFLSIRKRKIS